MLQEFKSFIMKGNVLDLAVAVIIGAAFGAINRTRLWQRQRLQRLRLLPMASS